VSLLKAVEYMQCAHTYVIFFVSVRLSRRQKRRTVQNLKKTAYGIRSTQAIRSSFLSRNEVSTFK